MYVYLYCLLYQEQYLDHLLLASSGRQVEGRESLPVKQAWHIRHTLLNGSYLDWSMWSTQSALRDDSAGKQIYFSFFLYLKKNIIISSIIQIFFSSLIRRIPSLPWSVTWGEKSDSNPQYTTASAVWRASNEPPHFHESWYLRNRLIVHKINFNSKSLFVVQYVKYVKKIERRGSYQTAEV